MLELVGRLACDSVLIDTRGKNGSDVYGADARTRQEMRRRIATEVGMIYA